jgi:transposase InsO family protein
VQLHANAKLTPAQRLLLVQRIRQEQRSVTEAAGAAGVSRQTAYKWLRRYRAEGEAGLGDRPCRPHRIPVRTPGRTLRRIEQLRRRRRAGWEIAQALGVPVSTVSKHLKALGLGRLWRLERELDPPQRYEHAAPGDLFHVDAKRFGRIEGIGHRIHGNRRQRTRGVGWEVVFVCVDDHTRLAYAEVLAAENGPCATAFFRRALRWFEGLGIHCKRVLTDNAKCYAESKAFRVLCEEHGIRQGFTRPYTPRTNGKAERFIQTLKRRWAYRHAYRTSAIRAASLRPWLVHYNHHRPHRSLGKRTPMDRLRDARQQTA